MGVLLPLLQEETVKKKMFSFLFFLKEEFAATGFAQEMKGCWMGSGGLEERGRGEGNSFRNSFPAR